MKVALQGCASRGNPDDLLPNSALTPSLPQMGRANESSLSFFAPALFQTGRRRLTDTSESPSQVYKLFGISHLPALLPPTTPTYIFLYIYLYKFISPHRLNIEVFVSITQDPGLNTCVKEPEYNAVHFSSDVAVSEYLHMLRGLGP